MFLKLWAKNFKSCFIFVQQSSLKHQIIEMASILDFPFEANDINKLNCEIFRLQNKEVLLKNEVRTLMSQLEKKQNQITTNPRQMQLQGKFVMTVQDQNNTDNARLVLQVNSMEKISEEDETESEAYF